MHIPPGYANIRFEMEHETTGQEAITAIGVGIEAADPPALLAGIEGVWEDNLAEAVSNVWNGRVIQLVVGTSNPSAPLVYERAPWVGGTMTVEPLPPNVSTVFTKRTARGGRKGRGRMFLPSPGEGGVDSAGRFSDSQFVFLVGAGTGFIDDLAALSGITDVVLLHSSSADAPDVITDLAPSRLIGQQKRRLRG